MDAEEKKWIKERPPKEFKEALSGLTDEELKELLAESKAELAEVKRRQGN